MQHFSSQVSVRYPVSYLVGRSGQFRFCYAVCDERWVMDAFSLENLDFMCYVTELGGVKSVSKVSPLFTILHVHQRFQEGLSFVCSVQVCARVALVRLSTDVKSQ